MNIVFSGLLASLQRFSLSVNQLFILHQNGGSHFDQPHFKFEYIYIYIKLKSFKVLAHPVAQKTPCGLRIIRDIEL